MKFLAAIVKIFGRFASQLSVILISQSERLLVVVAVPCFCLSLMCSGASSRSIWKTSGPHQ